VTLRACYSSSSWRRTDPAMGVGRPAASRAPVNARYSGGGMAPYPDTIPPYTACRGSLTQAALEPRRLKIIEAGLFALPHDGPSTLEIVVVLGLEQLIHRLRELILVSELLAVLGEV
jgi:hypothetical protein